MLRSGLGRMFSAVLTRVQSVAAPLARYIARLDFPDVVMASTFFRFRRGLEAAQKYHLVQGEVLNATNILHDRFYQLFAIALSLERPEQWSLGDLACQPVRQATTGHGDGCDYVSPDRSTA